MFSMGILAKHGEGAVRRRARGWKDTFDALGTTWQQGAWWFNLTVSGPLETLTTRVYCCVMCLAKCTAHAVLAVMSIAGGFRGSRACGARLNLNVYPDPKAQILHFPISSLLSRSNRKSEVLESASMGKERKGFRVTTKVINEALHFYPGTYDLLAKTKSVDNEKAFLKAKGNKYKYADMIYSALELPLRLISHHFRVQKPPRSTRSSKKSSSDDEKTEIDKELDFESSDKEEGSQQEAEAKGPSEHEPSEEEDTSIPLDKDKGFKVTTKVINEALHFYPGTYNLLAKTKSVDNEKAFLKAKGNKYKYADMIYSELELPLRLMSHHFRLRKPPRYTKPLLHIAVVMALAVAEKRYIRCNYGKFILETLIEANLKNSSKNKPYMSAEPMLTRIAYQDLGMIDDLPTAGSQASLIQHARFVPKAVKTTTTATSSRSTRSSKKSSSDDEKTETDKEQDFESSDKEEGSQQEAEAKGPSEHEPSEEEDTSIPLDRKSKKPQSAKKILLDEAMAWVEARKKALVDARATKTTKSTKPMTLEEARKIRLEKAKALQEERRRIEAEQKAQEDIEAQGAQITKEKEIVDLTGTIKHMTKAEWERHLEEQRAAKLAREKIKEALKRKAKEPIL
ncbi:hypothetical protein L7F22_053802 [Adiantum nelumboides]|nr:hypothetical protein [Adiantum nelumboides]